MGNVFGGFGGQIRDMAIIEGRDYPIGGKPGDGFDNMPGISARPGFQLPTPDVDPGVPNQQPPSSDKQGNEQYFLQMRQSIDSLNEAMKQIQGMQTPGGRYNSGDITMGSPGGGNYNSGAK